MTSAKTRVQFEDFQLSHFDIAPIWEFAIDEEGEEGQDETTLRPFLDSGTADPSEGIYVVKAEFETAGGKKYSGLCSPALEFSFGEIQPYIYTDSGTLSFWFGILEPNTEDIRKLYEQFGETRDTFFPIKFKALTPTKGIRLEGSIQGFMYLKGDEVKMIW